MAVSRSCGKLWIMIFPKRKGSPIGIFQWTRSFITLRYLFRDYGRFIYSKMAIPEQQRCFLSNLKKSSAGGKIIRFITGHCTLAVFLKWQKTGHWRRKSGHWNKKTGHWENVPTENCKSHSQASQGVSWSGDFRTCRCDGSNWYQAVQSIGTSEGDDRAQSHWAGIRTRQREVQIQGMKGLSQNNSHIKPEFPGAWNLWNKQK